MKNTFAKTYYVDNLNISVRIDRESFCWGGCRLTIKSRTKKGVLGFDRLVYTMFPNDKKLFTRYQNLMKKANVPNNDIKEIIEDIKINLMFEAVVMYKPIKTEMFWV